MIKRCVVGVFFYLFLMGSEVFCQSGTSLAAIYKKLGLSLDLSYTADMVVDSSHSANPSADPKNQGLSFTMKTFFKNGDIRTENLQGPMKFISIMKKEGTLFTCNPMNQTWMKGSLQDAMKEDNAPTFNNVGKETVDGKECQKYESIDQKISFKTEVWVWEGMIYKSVVSDPSGWKQTMRYQNIEKKELDDALFSPPKDAAIEDMNTALKNMMEKMKEVGEEPKSNLETTKETKK